MFVCSLLLLFFWRWGVKGVSYYLNKYSNRMAIGNWQHEHTHVISLNKYIQRKTIGKQCLNQNKKAITMQVETAITRV